MSVRTVHACMSDTYVDCPGFEQVYWLGDATVAAEVNLLNFAAYDYDYKCLKVVAQSLSDTHCSNYCKNKPGFSLGQRLVAPTYGSFVQGGLPMWSFYGCIKFIITIYIAETKHSFMICFPM